MTRQDGAEWLGSAGAAALVRCLCGARLCVSLPRWRRRSFTACDACGALILYASLAVVDPQRVEEFISMFNSQEEERASLLADVERELRRFVRAFDRQPEWLWSPATRRLVQTVKPKLELLGGPIGEGRGPDEYCATQEGAYQGEDELLDEGPLDEEGGDELDDDA